MKTKSTDERGLAVLEGLLILTILGLISFTGWYVWNSKNNADKAYDKSVSLKRDLTIKSINSFDECKKAPGSKVQESFPEVCVTKTGKRLIQTISDATANWLRYVAPSREFKMLIPDGWQLEQNGSQNAYLQAFNNKFDITPGVKATIDIHTAYGKDHDRGFFIQYVRPDLSDGTLYQVTNGTKKQIPLKTNSGLTIDKNIDERTRLPDGGANVPEGGHMYIYTILKNKELVYSVYTVGPDDLDYHSNIEKALQTVEIP